MRLAAALRPGLAFSALAALAVVVWQAALAAPDGRLRLTVLDVGTGDGLLIRSPTGRYVLVDGGPLASRLSDALGRRLPLGRREIDYLVVAAPSTEQVGALPQTLARFSPAAALWAGTPGASRSARDLREALAAARVPVTLAEAGQQLELGGGARLRVLGVGSRGAAMLLQFGRFRALLPVGVDFELLEALMADDSLSDISLLLLAENGYAPANPPALIARARPQVAVLSVAPDDFEGLPSPETLEAVEGYNLLRTDRNGWIELTTDGEQMWLEVERK